jgi:thioredoxin-related protein
MKTDEEIEDLTDKLEQYASYEGSEQGDVWRTLAYLWDYESCYYSEEFKNALRDEIVLQAENIDKNYEVVEETVSYTRKEKTLRHREE